MTPRRLIAIVSLISGAVALYLHLWKIGYAAAPACGMGSGCALAQFSYYGWFMGVDVALIGTVGYATLVVVALVGSLRRFRDARWPTVVLAALVGPAVLFTLRLKYGEFIVLRTFCPWCAVSAVAITICAILVWRDWQRLAAPSAGEELEGTPSAPRTAGFLDESPSAPPE